MKVALAVNSPGLDLQSNIAEIVSMAEGSAASGAQLVLFPEAATTGLINNDDPAHDLPLGEAIPGPTTAALAAVARCHGLWLGIGLLEREDNRLFDSAVLIDSSGSVVLTYRRNQPQWHGRNADPDIYCQGDTIPKLDTPWGGVSFLICGDLFDDEIVDRARALRPDLLLFPFARNFPGGVIDQERWDREEVPEYAGRAKLIGCTALMANYLGDTEADEASFGGAMVVSQDGEVTASLPLGRKDVLISDI
jgi:predicted amidohydrolase